MSEVLPPGWAVVPLGSVAHVQLGKMLSAAAKTGRGARPYLRNINVRWHRIDVDDVFAMDFNEREVEKFTLRSGDVLVCEGGEPGRAAVWRDQLPGALYQKALHRVRFIDDAVDPDFFVYQLELIAATGELARGFTGSTIKHLPREVFVELPLRIAPIVEQRRIVAALEEYLSALDAAVAGLERARANVQRFIASVLSAAAAGELIDGTAFGEWDAVTLQEVVDPTRKCAYGVLQPGPNVDDGVPLVRVGDVNDGVVSARDLKRISPAIASAYPRTRLRGGELLMTLVGTIGRTAVVPPDLAGANVARAIGVIPVGPRARAEWLNIWFRSPAMLSFMNAQAHEVARKTLNLEDVRAARVLLPPIDVQDQLVYAVEMRTDSARRLIGELDTQLARAKGVRRSILQSAFSGGLVPQDPADAPASIAPERDLTERSSAPASSRPARGRGRTARTGSRRG